MFGISAFAQSPYAGLGGNNRIQYASNGAYSYVGSDSIINRHSKILVAFGAYTYVGISSTSSLFIGDWELEFASPDVWTCQDAEAVTWVVETVAPITWN